MSNTPVADDIAISVRNVSKMYSLYNDPRDRLKQSLWYAVPQFLRGKPREFYREFWALKDISFDIRRGETVGIIGRNGGGKSTLLQIIAGTLTPTTGEVQIKGRVAALLELGSGFNTEFTGRENVYMNGSILGLSQTEMDELYDDIVAFADIGEFIDQPVKLYSSGMLVRLAFAVQAVVPKEVLIVDEALAVGDMFFQAKCMTRMKQLLDDGVTVLFVSHDTGAVKSLCHRGILLDQGQMTDDGPADRVIEKYFSLRIKGEQPVVSPSSEQASTMRSPDQLANSTIDKAIFDNAEFQKRAAFERIQNGKAYFINVQLLNQNGEEIINVEYDQEVTLRMVIEICEDIPTTLGFAYVIRNQNAVEVVYSDSFIEGENINRPQQGEIYVIDWKFKVALKEGNYNIVTALSIPIDLTLPKVDFCDYVPLAKQFVMAPRHETYLYGSVHWENQVEVWRHK